MRQKKALFKQFIVLILFIFFIKNSYSVIENIDESSKEESSNETTAIPEQVDNDFETLAEPASQQVDSELLGATSSNYFEEETSYSGLGSGSGSGSGSNMQPHNHMRFTMMSTFKLINLNPDCFAVTDMPQSFKTIDSKNHKIKNYCGSREFTLDESCDNKKQLYLKHRFHDTDKACSSICANKITDYISYEIIFPFMSYKYPIEIFSDKSSRDVLWIRLCNIDPERANVWFKVILRQPTEDDVFDEQDLKLLFRAIFSDEKILKQTQAMLATYSINNSDGTPRAATDLLSYSLFSSFSDRLANIASYLFPRATYYHHINYDNCSHRTSNRLSSRQQNKKKPLCFDIIAYLENSYPEVNARQPENLLNLIEFDCDIHTVVEEMYEFNDNEVSALQSNVTDVEDIRGINTTHFEPHQLGNDLYSPEELLVELPHESN